MHTATNSAITVSDTGYPRREHHRGTAGHPVRMSSDRAHDIVQAAIMFPPFPSVPGERPKQKSLHKAGFRNTGCDASRHRTTTGTGMQT